MNNFLNRKRIKILEENLGLKLTAEQLLAFDIWEKEFLNYNSHTNLMSRNEIPNLFEKHVYDSLSIVLWNGFKEITGFGASYADIKNIPKLMDIGTGGGFPSIILALCFPHLEVFANDSRRKKVDFIELARKNTDLKNLNVLYGRAEEILPQNADIITFRAVGKIKDILPLAKRHAAQGGKAVFYKAKDVEAEIDEALAVYKNLKTPEIVSYTLPLDVNTTRNLVIFEF